MYLPETVRIAHKTGTLAGVCNDAGIMWIPTPWTFVVLADGQEDLPKAGTAIGRFAEDLRKVIQPGE